LTVLNRPSEGLTSVLLVLWRTVRANTNAIKKERLIAHCAPPKGVADQQKQVKQTLTTWTDLGIFRESDDEIRLTDPFAKLDYRKDPTYLDFRRATRHVAMTSTHKKAQDFQRAAATLLASDIFGSHFSGHREIQKWENTHLQETDTPLFTNDTRWAGFVSWIQFLELAWSVGSTFMLDPTDAVKQELHNILQPDQKTPFPAFMTDLANQVPYLDSGRLQEQHLQPIRSERFKIADPVKNEISPAVSLAIIRLEQSGDIRLSREADTQAMHLLTKAFKPIPGKEFTHIALPQGGAR
jgi:hypothetical protein